MSEQVFTHGPITIRQITTKDGRWVDVTADRGGYVETIDPSSQEAHAAFIALHNSRRSKTP